MDCWICGNEATTGEHGVKRSDLVSMFGKGKLFLSNGNERNRSVQGAGSAALHFARARLCADCNNHRTQPYDMAWAKLSEFLRVRTPPASEGDIVNFSTVFPGRARTSMRDVHLYFVKHFGCILMEHAIPVDLGGFSRALLENRTHADVHLDFWAVPEKALHRVAGLSEVHGLQGEDGRPAFVWYFYEAGPIHVRVMWARPSLRHAALIGSWHPSRVTRLVRLSGMGAQVQDPQPIGAGV